MNQENERNQDKKKRTDANRDPITGAPGAHPVGTGVGAAAGGAAGVAGGAAAGAAIGSAGGPIGTGTGAVVGAVVGAVGGGLGGKAVAERVNPTREDAYWREHHHEEPYFDSKYTYDDYQGAYRTGYEGYRRLGAEGRNWDECEMDLQRDYEQNRGKSRLTWQDAKPAAQAAWNRVDRGLDRYIDFDVVDPNDAKIGTLQCIWSDHRGEPAFIGVQTGWLFGKTHVVPAEKVQVSEQTRKVRLPYPEEKVKHAPSYDQESEITRGMEDEVYRYYGVERSSGRGAMAQPRATETEARPGRKAEATPEQATIQLSEEQLKVGKREVEAGGVRLRKIVRTEVVNQPVEVKREELVIERVPAEEAHSGRQKAFNEQEVFIPLRREEVVVQKQERLREEVRARKQTHTDKQEISETVRREDIEIEESGDARRGQTGDKRRTAAEEIREREAQPRSMRRKD